MIDLLNKFPMGGLIHEKNILLVVTQRKAGMLLCSTC